MYWTKQRIIALVVALILIAIIPAVLIFYEVFPQGSGLFLATILLPLLIVPLTRRVGIQLGALLLIFLAYFSLFPPPQLEIFFDSIDYRVQRQFFRLRGPVKPSQEVAIIDIDNKSLKDLGQWPWPRTQVARVVKNLVDDGAKVIGFDIVFSSRDHQSLDYLTQTLQKLGIEVQASEKQHISGEQLKKLILSEQAKLLLSEKEQTNLSSEARDQATFTAFKKKHPKLEHLTKQELLLEMAKQTVLAYYVDMEWDDPTVFETGAPLIWINDEHLAEQVKNAPVVGGGWIKFPANYTENPALQREAEKSGKPFEGMVLGTNLSHMKTAFPYMKKGKDQVLNNEILQEALPYQGAFNIIPDSTGSARYYSLALQADYWIESLDLESLKKGGPPKTTKIAQKMVYPSLALEMARVGGEYEQVVPVIGQKIDHIELVGEDVDGKPRSLRIPVTTRLEIPINFLGYGGPWEPGYGYGEEYFFPYYSFVDVLQGDFEKGAFKDKYVIIGSTDPTLSDLIGSPFRPGYPGIEVHATMLDNLISKRWIADYDNATRELKFFSLVIGGAFLVVLLGLVGPAIGGIFTLFLLVGVPTLAYYTMVGTDAGMVSSFTYEWVAILILAATVLLIGYLETTKDRQFLKSQFGSMVSTEVLKKLQSDPEMGGLKGSKSTVSVLFSDIANFTTISEELSPSRLVSFLNQYFTPMTDLILARDGYIDKFIGDAVMACWGVPFAQDDHAIRACYSVLEQQKKIAELRPLLKKEFGKDLYVRFGVSSGIVSSAMVGSKSKKNYTVLGDVVNTSARLEPLCKFYGVGAIVSEATYEGAKELFRFRLLDRVVVKGKHRSVPIYALLGTKEEVKAREIYKLFEEAFALHCERKWDEALNIVNNILKKEPQDGPSIKLKEKIEEFKETPPPRNWEGERIFTFK